MGRNHYFASVPSLSSSSSSSLTEGQISKEEVMHVILQRAPMTTLDMVSTFKGRLKSQESIKNFAGILKKLCRLTKINGRTLLVLRNSALAGITISSSKL